MFSSEKYSLSHREEKKHGRVKTREKLSHQLWQREPNQEVITKLIVVVYVWGLGSSVVKSVSVLMAKVMGSIPI